MLMREEEYTDIPYTCPSFAHPILPDISEVATPECRMSLWHIDYWLTIIQRISKIGLRIFDRLKLGPIINPVEWILAIWCIKGGTLQLGQTTRRTHIYHQIVFLTAITFLFTSDQSNGDNGYNSDCSACNLIEKNMVRQWFQATCISEVGYT